MSYKRVIGLDIGRRSCGVALSDELGLTAQGRANFKFAEDDWLALVALLRPFFTDYPITTIVAGYPTYPSGDKSPTTHAIDAALAVIAAHFPQPIVRVDEAHTSQAAERVLIAGHMSRQKRKHLNDQVAAQLILQEYLDRAYNRPMDEQNDAPDARIYVTTATGAKLEGELIFEFTENGDNYVVYGIDDTMYAARYDDAGQLTPVAEDEWPLIERMIEDYFANAAADDDDEEDDVTAPSTDTPTGTNKR